MKIIYLTAVILFFSLAAEPARPQQAAKPLNKNQVMDLVQAGMDNAELAEKVKQAGIDFDLTDDYVQALRKAGAQDVLISALRAVRPKPLTRQQVLALVAGKVPSQRAADLVKQRGIDFVPDEDYFETLRVAGAEEVLLAALRTASVPALRAGGEASEHLNRGDKFVKERAFLEAITEYQLALKLNERSSLAYYRIGEVNLILRNYNSAAESFRAALRGDMQPQWTEVRSHLSLGKIFDLTGQRDRALNEYQRALRTGDNTQGAISEAKRLLEEPYAE